MEYSGVWSSNRAITLPPFQGIIWSFLFQAENPEEGLYFSKATPRPWSDEYTAITVSGAVFAQRTSSTDADKVFSTSVLNWKSEDWYSAFPSLMPAYSKMEQQYGAGYQVKNHHIINGVGKRILPLKPKSCYFAEMLQFSFRYVVGISPFQRQLVVKSNPCFFSVILGRQYGWFACICEIWLTSVPKRSKSLILANVLMPHFPEARRKEKSPEIQRFQGFRSCGA